jgi:cytochrome c peroxidase
MRRVALGGLLVGVAAWTGCELVDHGGGQATDGPDTRDGREWGEALDTRRPVGPPATGLEMQLIAQLFDVIPESPPDLPGNPLTEEKVSLATMLYFEPRLSSSWLISCNTCHNVGLGGVDLMETSVGHGWQRGPRNAPTVFNAVFNVAQFWDGRAEDLMEQAKGPIEASVEMNSDPDRVVATAKWLR